MKPNASIQDLKKEMESRASHRNIPISPLGVLSKSKQAQGSFSDEVVIIVQESCTRFYPACIRFWDNLQLFSYTPQFKEHSIASIQKLISLSNNSS